MVQGESSKDGWDEVEEMLSGGPLYSERERCLAVVRSEIESGRLRGIPETSGVMRILFRIESAIERG